MSGLINAVGVAVGSLPTLRLKFSDKPDIREIEQLG